MKCLYGLECLDAGVAGQIFGKFGLDAMMRRDCRQLMLGDGAIYACEGRKMTSLRPISDGQPFSAMARALMLQGVAVCSAGILAFALSVVAVRLRRS